MNILKFFEKSKKESIESLGFFYCLAEVVNYLQSKYGKSNNILIVNFIKLLEWCRSCLLSQVEDYEQSLTDYIFWQSREFYLESMRKFVAVCLNAGAYIFSPAVFIPALIIASLTFYPGVPSNFDSFRKTFLIFFSI